MEILDNVSYLLGDNRKRTFVSGAKLKIGATSFSIDAFEALVQQFSCVHTDSGDDNDSVKINVEQIFKLLSPSTEVKSV